MQRTVTSLPFSIILLPILIFAAGLRFLGIAANDLGLDEAISYFVINRPLLDIISYCLSRAYEHPPTYYILLNLWAQLVGTSEFALRGFSAGFGVLNVAVVAALGRRWFGPRIGLLTALLMTVWPLPLQQAREARMYPLLSFFSLSVVLVFTQATVKNRWRDWMLFLILFAVTLSIHYLFGLTVPAFVLIYLAWWRVSLGLRLRFGMTLALLVSLPILIAFAPGPRASLISFIEYGLRTPWSPERLLPSYVGIVIGGAAETWPTWLALIVSSLPWILFAIGTVNSHVNQADRRIHLAIALLVFIPALAGSLTLFYTAPRHHSALIGLVLLGVALGLDILIRRLPFVGLFITLCLLAGSLALATTQPRMGRSFSTPLYFAESRAAENEPMIFTYFFDRYQRDYYTRANLPPYYLGNQNAPLSLEQADQQVAQIMMSSQSAWLMLRPDEYNTAETVEIALNRQAYADEKIWFAGGRAIVHYFAPLPITKQTGAAIWDAGIRLNYAGLSGDVSAGNALRLDFHWQRTTEIVESLLVGLELSDSNQFIWARRLSVPCNGQCPTDKWDANSFLERQALYVPADTPPGIYQLYLYWLRSDGTIVQGQLDPGRSLRSDKIFLAHVTVDPPQVPIPATPPLAIAVGQSVRPGLSLRSINLTQEPIRVGTHLEISLQWEVMARSPRLDIQLQLAGPSEVLTHAQPLGTPTYPSDVWTPGRFVRTQEVFALPGAIGAGTYRVSVVVSESDKPETSVTVPLGKLELVDRPHRFDLPEIGVAVDRAWAEGIRLARVAAPASAQPGTSFPITLVWQAGGAAARNWKVFIHLVDETGTTRAQGDAYPINDDAGSAPTSTWRAGEVIVDPHVIILPPDLPSGVYAIQIGFYDEVSSERLPLSGGGDTFTLPALLDVQMP